MGDFTPEALEVQCPGCKARFRIRTKSEHLDNTTVSCPKCFADIPVESNRLPAGSSPSPDLSQVDVAFSRVETRRTAAFPPEKTPSSTIRSLTAPTLNKEAEDAVDKLERLSLGTFTEPNTIRATFSGFPGSTSDNPFQRAKTTASTQSPLLQDFIDLDKQQRSVDPPSLDDVHSEATLERDTPNIFRKKKENLKDHNDAHLRQTSELDAVVSAQAFSRKTMQQLETPQEEAQQSQIISKLRARLPLTESGREESENLPQITAQPDSESLIDDSYAQLADGTTGVLKADSIPEEYREWHDFSGQSESALEAESTLAHTSETGSAPDSDSEPTLAKLFKRAQKRRAALGGEASAAKKTQPAVQPTTLSSTPSISVEITEDEVASILDRSTELSQSRIKIADVAQPTLPAQKPAKASPPPRLPTVQPGVISAPKSKTAPLYSLKEKLLVTEHSGIHDGLFADVPRPADKPPHPITHDSIVVRPDRSGKTTSQSMLARLRQRRESMEIDATMASESRGSGFIRLPTAEIQQVLGRGSYRLLIENIVYEPVDKDGLIQLIKGGVLLGAEQIAEADGDWMPVSQHPVFEELRRRFAAEAHALLSRISNPREVDPAHHNNESSPKAEPDVLVSSPILINEDSALNAISDPSPFDVVSESLLAISKEPNFAMLTDSEAEADSEAIAAEEQSITESLFEQDDSEPARDSGPDLSVSAESAQPAANGTVGKTDSIQHEPPRKSKKGLLVLVLILIAVGVAAYVFTQSDKPADSKPGQPTPTQQLAIAPIIEKEEPAPVEPEKTHETNDQQPAPAENIEKPAKAGFDNSSYLQWQTGAKDPAESLTTARKLLEQKDFKHARAIAAYGMANFENANDFRETFNQSIQDDKDLHSTTALEPVAIFSINSIRIEDTGQNQYIILTRDGADRFIFKPARTENRDAWRSEIAAYRLCQMILCNFEIPHTAPAKITREEWERIAPESELTDKLDWETSADDTKLQFVRGALQELVPETTPWPIEITGLWREWLGTAPTFNALNEDFVQAHERIKNFADGTMYPAILERQNNVTTRELAAQVSTLILFDFLTNNWERFSGNSANYGRGTPFAQGKIVSFNNGQSFQSRASRRVLGRFEWTGRFSRSTVAAVRALTPELANSVLFDQPSAIERARLDTFWNQHRQAMSRIDASIERHGNDLVFTFD